MADIRAFRALRPRTDLAAEIAAPPYDVLSRKEAEALLDRRPRSFIRVTRPDALLPELDRFDERTFVAAQETLSGLIAEGAMVLDPAPSLYLYELTREGHVQLGVVAGASLAEYEAGSIRQHEKTRKPELEGRTRHIQHTRANTGPVFLTYRADARIDRALEALKSQAPEVSFTADDGVGHRVWVVRDQADIDRLRGLFEAVPALYIADGHHRTAASNRVRKGLRDELGATAEQDLPCDHFLAVMFPHDQLRILSYNRVVLDLYGHTVPELLKAVGRRFEISPTEAPIPEQPRQFGMYVDGRWYRLHARPDSFDESDPLLSLDVAILQENLIRPILGIEHPRSDPRIQFVGGVRGVAELERRASAANGVAFYLYPVSIEEVMSIADAGQVMPPKSTWFEPKLRSGLIVRVLDEDRVVELAAQKPARAAV